MVVTKTSHRRIMLLGKKFLLKLFTLNDKFDIQSSYPKVYYNQKNSAVVSTFDDFVSFKNIFDKGYLVSVAEDWTLDTEFNVEEFANKSMINMQNIYFLFSMILLSEAEGNIDYKIIEDEGTILFLDKYNKDKELYRDPQYSEDGIKLVNNSLKKLPYIKVDAEKKSKAGTT